MNATVLSFSSVTGWGWAMPDDQSNDVFVHRNNMPAERKFLNVGDKITYDIGQHNGKPVALNIRLIEAAPVPKQNGVR